MANSGRGSRAGLRYSLLATRHSLSWLVRPAHLPEPHHALGCRGRQALEIAIGDIETLVGGVMAARPTDDDCLDGRPSPARRFAENENGIGSVAAHQPVNHLDRHGTERSDP